MDKRILEALSASVYRLCNQAKDMYREAYALDPKRFDRILADHAEVSFDGDSILFRGWEPWQYGVHLEDGFPFEWFYTDWQKEVIAFRDARTAKEKKIKSAKKKKADKLERKRYLELKKKWER